MNKSIFVIDTPTSCSDCYRVFNDYQKYKGDSNRVFCTLTNVFAKPDERYRYCPLIDLPEGIDPDTDEIDWSVKE